MSFKAPSAVMAFQAHPIIFKAVLIPMYSISHLFRMLSVADFAATLYNYSDFTAVILTYLLSLTLWKMAS